ncbi:MAG: hypothetical protein II200_09120 [Bacteroidaceae bacterium]|nr:hypothetical protein [Bacteroidaceae bacterium]
MNRRLLLVAATLLTATTALATEQSDTLVVKFPSEVTVINNDSSCIIKIQGKNGAPTGFSYRQVIPLTKDTPTLINESNTEWNFKMPFISTSKKESTQGNVTITATTKSHVKKHRWENASPQLNVGLGLFGIGYVASLNTPQSMHTEMFDSYEFLGPRLMFMYQPRMSRFSYGIGVGTNWKNFRMTEDVRFSREPNGNVALTNYPEGVRIGFSRVKVFSWTVPLEVKYYLTDKVSLSASSIINFNTYASLKTRYTTAEGHGIKELDKHLHQNPVTVDFMGHLKFGAIGWYVKYSPCNVFESGRGPKFQAWSTGLTFCW